MCRLNTLYMIQRAGSGHIGSSFSSLDIVTWLFLKELQLGSDVEHIYFSSKGHDSPGLYSVMIALGLIPFDSIHTLRQLGGLPGHPDVSTPGIVANTGSLGMGISKAKGMVQANRLSRQKGQRIFVMLGDGEMQEGQLWESLASAVKSGMWEITAIVDRNRIQSDTWVDLTSPQGDVKSRFRACGWRVETVNGHDFEGLEEVFSSVAEERKRPQVIFAETGKGHGVLRFLHSADENDDTPYPYHSGAVDPELYSEAFRELKERIEAAFRSAGGPAIAFHKGPSRECANPLPYLQKLVPAYEDALANAAKERKKLVALDADLKFDCGLGKFAAEHRERFFECGIAEQDMVSQAGAMAGKGFLPIVHSFSCFLTARANEQIFNNATERTNVTYSGFLAGVVPGGPGHSHQAVRDIAALRGIPDMLMAEPCCEADVPWLLATLLDHAGPSYLRICSIPWERVDIEAIPAAIGHGRVLLPGRKALCFAYGPVLVSQALAAANASPHDIGVVELPWLSTVDSAWLADLVKDTDILFSLDNHQVDGGQGTTLGQALASLRSPAPRLVQIGVEGIAVCGTNSQVLAHHGLDAQSLVDRFDEVLRDE
ncbi:transketolase [Pseudodesulfovibrio cashew]|uniref:Transketolase n=2 Tax=Pseudodesulfovibrio cashew TaxID=2678688 RepID=A0A6I6JPD0_9BACT|nr:transketolase [Pseudodesulfovibrio cashew]